MGLFSSLKRYILTLGGLIGGDIDSQTDKMLSTPSGVKATFQQTRENWTEQYAEVREAVAQLMMVLEQKKNTVTKLSEQLNEVQVKMRGAVNQFKKTNDNRYQQAFSELYKQEQNIKAEQENLDQEIKGLQGKVVQYKEKLTDMQKLIQDLKKQEAAAIADIVSSKQIISLNDRLNNMSTALDDRNLQAVQDQRERLKAEATLSEGLAEAENLTDMDEELKQAGMDSEAADIFAAMLADNSTEAPEKTADSRDREI